MTHRNYKHKNASEGIKCIGVEIQAMMLIKEKIQDHRDIVRVEK
jgi:hypothetical protein